MSGPNRLLIAAVLCALSLGLGWAASRDSTGYTTPGMVLPTVSPSLGSGELWMGSQYYAGYWVEGNPMRAQRGYSSDARVVLVPAALILAWASQNRTDLSQRLVRLALLALTLVGGQALARGMTAAAISVAAVLMLAVPVVAPDWLSRMRLGRFVPRLSY